MLNFEYIKTSRLLIRPPSMIDAVIMQKAMKDSFSVLKKWMPWARGLASVADTEYYIHESEVIWAQAAQNGIERPLQILSLDQGQFIGATGIKPQDIEIPSFEVGYWANQEFAGQGLMTEATNALVRYLFRTQAANRIEINCDAINERSAKVAERLGFVKEGLLRNHRLSPSGSELSDTLVYSLLDESLLPSLDVEWD